MTLKSKKVLKSAKIYTFSKLKWDKTVSTMYLRCLDLISMSNIKINAKKVFGEFFFMPTLNALGVITN